MSRSVSCCMLPLVRCLVQAVDIVGGDVRWSPVDPEQESFLNEVFYPTIQGHAQLLSRDVSCLQVRAIASRPKGDLEVFYRAHDFLRRAGMFGPYGFAAAGFASLLLDFPAGREEVIQNGEKHYPAIRLDHGVSVFYSDAHRYPVAVIDTESDVSICMTVAGTFEPGYQHTALLRHLKRIKAGIKPDQWQDVDNVVFPMARLCQEVDVSWFQHLRGTVGDDITWCVEDGKLRTELRMGSGRAVLPWSKPKTQDSSMKIDKPFYLWIEEPDFKVPLYAAFVGTDNWERP